MKLGTAILEIRKKKKIKQVDLAQSVNISNSRLCEIEKNVSMPKITTLEEIAFGLGIKTSIIFSYMESNGKIDDRLLK